ncbi:hypothetical protein DSO57_1024335 [Entomophthora muscae]|uniref:Uncharacterized protein n=1 Tax=Entomophthora muscae TaxID=34485 RepID=A0ACC2TDD4_9FUNG|nr:hypothetical protein DSO57_1024335 [Entomophthora muscae]
MGKIQFAPPGFSSDPLTLHRLVIKRDTQSLKQALLEPEKYISNNVKLGYSSHADVHPLVNQMDHRGCTPLHLAIMTGQKEMIRLLVQLGGASVLAKNAAGWSCVSEAISYGNREIIKEVLFQKQMEVTRFFRDQAPRIAQELSKELDNFKVELNWKIKSWVPLVSNVCPSDTYTIWKKGPTIRIDTTLVGFEKLRWLRGRQTFLFHTDPKQGATLTVVDHNRKLTQRIMTYRPSKKLGSMPGHDPEIEEEVSVALNSKISITNIPTTSISFRREYVGVWGFKTPRMERVSGYDCEVWKVNNIELRSRTRTEHLSHETQDETPEPFTLDEKLLTVNAEMAQLRQFIPSLAPPPSSKVTYEEYFNSSSSNHIHLGRPLVCKDSRHSFNATVWMAPPTANNPFPITLQQLKPIFQVASLSSDQLVDKLHHLIDSQLPPGFPVKAVIPILPMISVQITFGDFSILSSPPSDSHFQVPSSAQGYSPGLVLTKSSHE